jgi:hypothetical protein
LFVVAGAAAGAEGSGTSRPGLTPGYLGAGSVVGTFEREAPVTIRVRTGEEGDHVV